VRAGEVPQGIDRAEHHGQYRRPCRAGDSESKAEDEDGVQDEIGHGPENHRLHRTVGAALRAHEVVHAEADVGEHIPVEQHIQVGPRVGDGGLRAAEEQERAVERQEGDRRHDQDHHADHGQRLAQHLLRVLVPPPSQAERDQRARSHADQHPEGGQHGHVGQRQRQPRDGIASDALPMYSRSTTL
jgi:hypothetical protein